MEKFIDAEAMVRIATEAASTVWEDDEDTRFLVTEVIKRAANAMPAAPVRREVHAAWEPNPKWPDIIRTCSVCKHDALMDGYEAQELSDFCPNCGAIMDLDAKGAEG